MDSVVRHPAVAGRFYPSSRETLLRDLRSYLSPRAVTAPAFGCIVPHAGYIYSGAVAGVVFAKIDLPASCIVLCPNHTGKGRPLAIVSRGTWETPLGEVAINSQLAELLKKQFPLLAEDVDAHRSEHAIEVELPFFQVRRPGFTFVPIALGTGQFETLEKLGEAVAETIASQGQRILIVASSDMNHYESEAVTRVKDRKAIERILALDARGLYSVVMREHISMCGFGPAIVMLTAAKRLGSTSAELVQYATSGDVSGDRDMVVGYAGVICR